MELVGTRNGEDVDRRPGVSALLCIEIVGPDFHRLHNFRIGGDRGSAAAGRGIRLRAIYLVSVLLLAQSGGVDIDGVFVGKVIVAPSLTAAPVIPGVRADNA